jgi:hypothetical protein
MKKKSAEIKNLYILLNDYVYYVLILTLNISNFLLNNLYNASDLYYRPNITII